MDIRAIQASVGPARPAGRAAAAPAQTPSPAEGRYDVFSPKPEEEPSKTLLEVMREAREKAEARAKQLKPKVPARYGDLPLEAYGRLSRARSKADAAAAAGYARRCLARLRAALRQDDEHAGAIRCAMRQLEKVSVRANRKKRDIDREQLMELRRRRAAEQARRRESTRLHTELQRRRAVRAIRESGYLHETVIAQGFQAYRDAVAAEIQARSPTAGTEAAGGTEAVAGAEAAAVGMEAAAAVGTFSLQV